jgi:uncharacterized protein (TIGR03792 family)
VDAERVWAVVEELEIDVAAGDVAAFLERDADVWTTYLRTCPGFLAKEVWVGDHRPGTLVIQIWWRSRDDWKAVPPAELASLGARMGEWHRAARCREYRALVLPRGAGEVA